MFTFKGIIWNMSCHNSFQFHNASDGNLHWACCTRQNWAHRRKSWRLTCVHDCFIVFWTNRKCFRCTRVLGYTRHKKEESLEKISQNICNYFVGNVCVCICFFHALFRKHCFTAQIIWKRNIIFHEKVFNRHAKKAYHWPVTNPVQVLWFHWIHRLVQLQICFKEISFWWLYDNRRTRNVQVSIMS